MSLFLYIFVETQKTDLQHRQMWGRLRMRRTWRSPRSSCPERLLELTKRKFQRNYYEYLSKYIFSNGVCQRLWLWKTCTNLPHYSLCSFSMMVKWANDVLHQANDGEMLVNDGEMSIITLILPSLTNVSPALTSILPSLAWSKPSFAHFTIIEKLHRLHYSWISNTVLIE